MGVIQDNNANPITEFPLINGKRVMPIGHVDEDGNQESFPIKYGDSPSIDAFARLRVSSPVTLFDSKLLYDASPLFWDDEQTSGSGTTSVHSPNLASVGIGVSNLIAGTRVRQTFMRFNYQPGKSQLILMTFSNFITRTGITKRVGIFSSNNGLFFQSSAGVVSVVRRSYVTGAAVDTAVAQSNWNIDTMDGEGKSGIELDFTKAQIAVIDYEWLGVGRVRMGFVIDGLVYYCHEFLNTNNLSTVYMSTPNLPLRYEISNDGTGTGDYLTHICSSVISEGGSEDNGIIRYASTSGTHVDANTENTIYAIIGIRLKSSHIGTSIKIINAAIQIQTGTNRVEWMLKLNPTVAGAFTYTDQTNSAVQIATGATANTVTGGIDIAGGFAESGGVQSGNAGSDSRGIDNAILLGSDINGVRDTLVLCARPIGGSTNVDVEGSLSWRGLL